MSESMAEEWAKWLEREKSNVDILEQRIAELSTNHDSSEGFQYMKFWAETDEIFGLLETLAPLPENEKVRLRVMLDNICRETKKRQQHERRELQANSSLSRQYIEEKIHRARAMADSAPDDIKTLNKAQSLLKSALAGLKNGIRDSETEQSPPKPGLMKNDRQACWDKWRQTNDIIHECRQAIWNSNYRHVEDRVQNAVDEASDGNPHEALNKIKSLQSDLKGIALNREQREELKGRLNKAWDKAIFKVNEIREEKQRKYEQWLSRMEGQLEQLEEQLKQNQDEGSRLQSEIEQSKEAIQSVRAKDYGDSLREKIAEKREKIKELGVMSKQLEGRIQALKIKIDGQTSNYISQSPDTDGPAEQPDTGSQ